MKFRQNPKGKNSVNGIKTEKNIFPAKMSPPNIFGFLMTRENDFLFYKKIEILVSSWKLIPYCPEQILMEQQS